MKGKKKIFIRWSSTNISIFQLSRERDILHGQLDERAIEAANLRKSLQEANARAEDKDSAKSRSAQPC